MPVIEQVTIHYTTINGNVYDYTLPTPVASSCCKEAGVGQFDDDAFRVYRKRMLLDTEYFSVDDGFINASIVTEIEYTFEYVPLPDRVPIVHACNRLPEYVLVMCNDEDDMRYVPERHCSMTNRVLVWRDAVHDEDHKWQAFVCSNCGAKTRGINIEYDVTFRPKYCPNCGWRVV